MLEDPYGNTYRYSKLGEVAETYPAPRTRKAHDRELELPKAGKQPAGPASRTKQAASHREPAGKARPDSPGRSSRTPKPKALPAAVPSKERLFAHPRRPNAKDAGGAEQLGLLEPDEPLFIDGEKLNSPQVRRQAAAQRAPASSPAPCSAASAARATSWRRT